MRIVVELIAAKVVDDELRYQCMERDCPRTGDPNLTAKAALAARFPDLWLQNAILHSTSWRYEDDRIVLTYLGYSELLSPEQLSEHFPLGAVKDPDDGPHAVAAHAVRHLAFLVREDPRRYKGKLQPSTLSALARVAPEMAGRRDLKGAA